MALEIDDINLSGAFSATTISATTIVFGGQPIQNVFVQNNITGGFLPISGGTVTGETIFNGGLSANTLFSGSTNLYDIFSTGGPGGASTYVQPGANITTGGTASEPIVSLVDSPSVNNISFSGTAFGGNVQAGSVTSISLSAGTLSGGTILSGGTNLYSIFQTIGNTDQDPFLNLSGGTVTGNTVFTQGLTASTLSANTINLSGQLTGADGAIFANLSGTSIFSGSTNLQSTFNLFSAANATKANLSGATFTGQVNVPTLSATTLSATTSVFTSSFRFPVSPVAGYILTSDASGNATWAASPTSGSGTTKLDMQTISTATTATATTSLVDVPGMVLTAKNLGASTTTYIIIFTGQFSNNSNSGNSTLRATLNGVQIPGSPLVVFSNAGASLNGAFRSESLTCRVTGVTNGDVIRIQMSASTGTLTAQAGKTLSIIGTLKANIV